MRMRKHAGRFGVLGSAVVLATVALTAVAYACTNLATLNLSKGSGVPGTTVTVTGSSFAAAESGQASPVVLHWNGAGGPVLAQAIPDGAGNISTTLTVPQGAAPGYGVIVATQADPEGGAAYGTPARASFQVTGPGGGAVQQPPPQPAVANAAPSSPSSTGILALTAGLGFAGLVLFGVGITAFLRQARRREAPVPATVRRED